MTWSELHGVLRARGLISADDALRAEAAVGMVTGIAYDSRRLEPGNVFVALRGHRADGLAFVHDALDRGASAIVAEGPAPGGVHVPWAIVKDARLALAVLAASFYRNPSDELQVVGITGTNGKTTTAYIVASIFDAAGIRCGVLGTVAYRIGDEVRDATRTTPEAPDVQELLREMVERGCGACAMEVSSHALSLRRVEDMRFAAGVFTNLTRDHLDYHGDMESYFAAKRRLFEMLSGDAPAIINMDDHHGSSLVGVARRTVTYGLSKPADVTAGPLSFSVDGLRFDIKTPRGIVHVDSKLVGRPNVYNIVAAVATAVSLDVPIDAIAHGVRALDAVPGRFQVVSKPDDDVTVIVDYAHTDDALRNLLETARPLAKGRVITVFGAGGDRDRTKRPLMGAVAGRLSDVVVITSDNPRSEEPARIIDEIRRGLTSNTVRSGHQSLAIEDRRDAIVKAVGLARPGDMVLIAGKGHEKYQEIGGRVLAFDDAAVAREALERRRTKSDVV